MLYHTLISPSFPLPPNISLTTFVPAGITHPPYLITVFLVLGFLALRPYDKRTASMIQAFR